PRRPTVQAVWDRIVNSSIADVSMLQLDDEHPHFNDTVRVCVSTIHSAKGLEYRAVHLVGMDLLETLVNTNHRNVAFTGVTRTKTSLSVYHSVGLAGFLEQAVALVHPKKGPPRIQDAFGRRGQS